MTNNPYLKFVEGFSTLLKSGEAVPAGSCCGQKAAVNSQAGAPVALIFAPHPDDESIFGGFPLRLIKEAGMKVVNVAVTLGSNKERQSPRFAELKEACNFLGFEVIKTAQNGLEKINLKTRAGDTAHWSSCVETVANIIREQNPKVIFVPHAADWNSSHIGTHYLVMDALKQIGPKADCFIVETEFWAPMSNPNLMIELSVEDTAALVGAISCHVGEVERNPYHLRLPAWLQDNVRRGGELVGGQGAAVPKFDFATLYRLYRWKDGNPVETLKAGRFMSVTDSLSSLF